MENNENLFGQFSPVTKREWMDKINSDLKGADFNEKLVWKTDEGFEVCPFYRKEDIENLPYIDLFPGQAPYIRGTRSHGNNWLIRQDITVTDFKEANLKARSVLMNGVDSLGFKIENPESINEVNFDILLKDIDLESVELNFLSDVNAAGILDLIKRTVESRRSDNWKFCGAIEADPLVRLFAEGGKQASVEADLDRLADIAEASSVLDGLRFILVDASCFKNSGADIVKELAYAISIGSEYMSQLTGRGINAKRVASGIRFRFGIGSSYFMEIAKLRAARLLWSVVNNGFQSDGKMEINCVTGRRNKRADEPYINILRTQTEAMSAILGGTDSLTVEPFDAVLGQPEEFSERIARNQQLILKEESYFDRVADPAAGSYYIENLTRMIAENAWRLFIEIDKKGGFLSSMNSEFNSDKL